MRARMLARVCVCVNILMRVCMRARMRARMCVCQYL